MASSPGMSARATSSDQWSPRDKLAAASILSGGIRRGSSFLKPPRNLGVGTKTVMPRRSASARSGRCGESGLTLMAVALFHGSMSRSRAAATSAPAKFGIRPCDGNGKRATPSALSLSQTHCRAALLSAKSRAMTESGAARPGDSQGHNLLQKHLGEILPSQTSQPSTENHARWAGRAATRPQSKLRCGGGERATFGSGGARKYGCDQTGCGGLSVVEQPASLIGALNSSHDKSADERQSLETSLPRAEPKVRIQFPPAESPCLTQTRPLQVENRGFRAGVRRSVGGAVGRDAPAGAISRQRIAMSLSGLIPVPQCRRRGLGTVTTPAHSKRVASGCADVGWALSPDRPFWVSRHFLTIGEP